MHKQKGFTLIELLVVITIIAVLAAGGIVAYNGVNVKSRDARRTSDLRNIRAALELYRSNNGEVYPTSIPNSGGFGTGICAPSDCSVSNGVYMRYVPGDPKSTLYKYYYSSDGNSYTVGAYTEGGGTGGATCGSYSCDAASGSTKCNLCYDANGQVK